MTDYIGYFLASPSTVVQLDLLEISHPDFTQTYWVVRNSPAGVTVTLETSATQTFEYYPMQIRAIGSRDDLDFGLQITFGDLGEIIPSEMDEVASADGFGVKPVVKYRAYRSDDLSAPMFGPVVLEVTTFSFKREGSSFEAKAPALNVNKTGEFYDLERFPMLRGFL